MSLPIVAQPKWVRARRWLDAADIETLLPCLQPADLFAFFHPDPPKSVVVRCQQAYGFSYHAAEVSHVALYLGHGLLCHAVPFSSKGFGGVMMEPLVGSLAGSFVSVLRFKRFMEQSQQELAERIAAHARARVGAPYDFSAVRDLAVSACRMLIRNTRTPGSNGRWRTQSVLAPHIERWRAADPLVQFATDPGYCETDEDGRQWRGFLCSDLIFDCFDAVLRADNPLSRPELMRSPHRLPAEFYLNDAFLNIEWTMDGLVLSEFQYLG